MKLTDTEIAPAAKNVSRRSIVAGAAWTAPVIALSVATPAMAASIVPSITALTPISPQVVRCGTLPAGTLTFQALENGLPAPAGQPVVVTLPTGLAFSGATGAAATVQTFTTDAAGRITLPAILPSGAAGTYSIQAAYSGANAYSSVPVATAPGDVWTFGVASTPFNLTGWSPLTASTGSSSDGAYYAIDPTGIVHYWGWAFPSGGTLPVTNAIKTSLWSINSTNWYTGGLLLDSSNRVFLTSSNNSAPTTQQVTGFTGTVLDIQAHTGSNYILTTNGVFYSGPGVGTPDSVFSGPIPGSAGATLLSTNGVQQPSGFYSGGAFLGADGNVYSFSTHQSAPGASLVTGLPTGAKVVKLVATDGALVALTSTGDLWVAGPAYQASNGFVLRASNITDFSATSQHSPQDGIWYAGGAAIGRDGSVLQFSGQSSNGSAWSASTVPGLVGSNIVEIYATDGQDLALSSDGKLFKWGIGGATAAQVAGLPVLSQVFPFAYHDNGANGNPSPSGQFFGNVLAIASTTC